MSSNNPDEDVKLVKPVKNIYDEVKEWYTQKGISTSQFFNDNSTEMGIEEMMIDFSYRALSLESKLSEAERKLKVAREALTEIGTQQYGRPTEMMVTARKAFKEITK